MKVNGFVMLSKEFVLDRTARIIRDIAERKEKDKQEFIQEKRGSLSVVPFWRFLLGQGSYKRCTLSDEEIWVYHCADTLRAERIEYGWHNLVKQQMEELTQCCFLDIEEIQVNTEIAAILRTGITS